MSSNVQNLNKLTLIQAKLNDIRLLARYLDDIETSPTLARLVKDIEGAGVSCTTAIRTIEGKDIGYSYPTNPPER